MARVELAQEDSTPLPLFHLLAQFLDDPLELIDRAILIVDLLLEVRDFAVVRVGA
ncbi:hypothetical protein D3C86_1793830 [compost metagenome]